MNIGQISEARPSPAHDEPHARENERLWKVAQQFEALLWQQMVAEMQKSVPKSDLLPNGFAEDVHSSMYAQALADVLSLGQANQPLVHAIYTQLGGKTEKTARPQDPQVLGDNLERATVKIGGSNAY